MNHPTKRQRWAPRLVAYVESSVGSGVFHAEGRLEVEYVRREINCGPGIARLRVKPESNGNNSDFLRELSGDRRILVSLGDEIIFNGYTTTRHITMQKKRGRGGVVPVETIELSHAYQLHSQCVTSIIIGRHVRDFSTEQAITLGAGGFAHQTTHATALPCIFNSGGRGNRNMTPIVVPESNGVTNKIPIFTDDDDSTASRWTVGEALRYLLYFHSSEFDRSCCFEAIRSLANAESGNDESDPSLNRALRMPLRRLDVDGKMFLEGLRDIAHASSLVFDYASQFVGARVETDWRFDLIDSSRIPTLQRGESPRDRFGKPIDPPSQARYGDRVLVAGARNSFSIHDDENVETVAIVSGAIKTYEVCVELVPGWRPEPNLDNVALANQTSAKSLSLDEAEVVAAGAAVASNKWYQRYHMDGSLFDLYRDVARKWVLNEAGAYATAEFGRAGIFAEYNPFDFSTQLKTPLMRRRRPLIQSVAGSSIVKVEISFDDGDTWHIYRDGFDILNDECGIWFSATNPLSITMPAADGANLWHGLIEQMVRVRVSGTIEGDTRVMATVRRRNGVSLRTRGLLIHRGDQYQSHRSLDGSNDVDGSAAARLEARDIAERTNHLAVVSTYHLHWLESSYRLGDPVTRQLGLAGYPTDTRPGEQGIITAITYYNGPTKYGTEISLSKSNV